VIDQQVTNTSFKGKDLYKKKPDNTKKGSWERQHIYQIGRDGQTLGKKDKKKGETNSEIKPHIPICPYHMPTNYNRYNDPSLHVPYKNRGNIIELKDINRLIERITLYTHLWNADPNDLNSYGISSRSRSKYNLRLPPIGTTLEGAASISITTGQNTIRQNTPFIRIGYFSQSEYNALNHILFTSPTVALNTSHKIKDYVVGENIGITFPDISQGRLASSGNPTILHYGQEKLFKVSTYLDGSFRLILNYYREDSNYDKDAQQPAQFSRTSIGGISIDHNRYFVISYREPDKSALNPELRYIVFKLWFYDSSLKISNTTPTTETRETDWSVREQVRGKRGKHPTIQAKNFENIRNSLNDLIEALDLVAKTTLGEVPDTTTKTNIEDFKFSHVKNNSGFDPNDPDTSFYGYQAQKSAIIKVGFYNTLVDAYKLLINSCMCNCDCKCNSNCVCNTNCGCNYG
jgi:hypothetical protein